jgi:formate dehydrogenase major subunit
LVRGDSANELIAFTGDPNVSIQESKALTGSIEPGRYSRGRRTITSGPVVRTIPPGVEKGDLPVAQHRPEGAHGFKASETKEGNA